MGTRRLGSVEPKRNRGGFRLRMELFTGPAWKGSA